MGCGLCPGRSQQRAMRLPLDEVQLGEFTAGTDPGFGENVAEMEVDGARAEEQLGGDVAVG